MSTAPGAATASRSRPAAAYDDIYRNITAIDASQHWQNAICGDNPNAFLPAANTQPACVGLNVAVGGTARPTSSVRNAAALQYRTI